MYFFFLVCLRCLFGLVVLAIFVRGFFFGCVAGLKGLFSFNASIFLDFKLYFFTSLRFFTAYDVVCVHLFATLSTE